MDANLKQRLKDDSARAGVMLDERVTSGLARYLDLLLFWNRKVNLTAVRDPEAIIDKHFVDSLAVIPHIPPSARTLADLGTGAGFPGAVIALARPDLSVFLVESIHKKTAFLEALRRDLPLPNAIVHTIRAEDWRPATPPDAVISRATWDLTDWLTKGRQWVRPGGHVLAMEADTVHPLPANATRHPYPNRAGTRALIVLQT